MAAALLIPSPLAAQPRGTSDPGGFRSEMRMQGYYFDNFFHSTNPAEERNVTALGSELRGAYRPGERPLEVFGHLSVVRYGVREVPESLGGRIGVRHDGAVHQWTAYLDRAENRPSFEVGNTFGSADVTTVSGAYAYRVVPEWEFGAEGIHQRQTFSAQNNRRNDYTALGASVRYRGFGWRFRPEIGLDSGRREVVNAAESYDTRDWYVQASYMPVLPRDPLYLSLRYRDRNRAYTISDPGTRNFGRREVRGEWMLLADLRIAQNVNTWMYFTTENVDSSVPGGNFEVGFLLVGVTIGF